MVKLCWSQREADAPLQAFLARHPPSKTFNPPGGDGWIWVRSNRGGGVEGERANDVEGARNALDGLVERYAEIEVSEGALFEATTSRTAAQAILYFPGQQQDSQGKEQDVWAEQAHDEGERSKADRARAARDGKEVAVRQVVSGRGMNGVLPLLKG